MYLVGDTVAKLEYPMNEESLAHAQERFGFVYDKYLKGTNVRTYLSVIPDKNYFLGIKRLSGARLRRVLRLDAKPPSRGRAGLT